MRCATLAALACALGLVRAVPTVPEQSFEEAVVGNGSAESDGSRRLQAGGRPDQCSDDSSFQAWLALVNSACCTHAATPCTNGLPSSCDEECANVLTPVRASALDCSATWCSAARLAFPAVLAARGLMGSASLRACVRGRADAFARLRRCCSSSKSARPSSATVA